EPSRRIQHRGNIAPDPGSTLWTPAPAVNGDVEPRAIVVGGPPPRVTGNPGVAEAGIRNPGAVGKWIPCKRRKCGPPYVPVGRNVVVVSVVAQVAGSITLAILVALLVPIVIGIGVDLFGQSVTATTA